MKKKYLGLVVGAVIAIMMTGCDKVALKEEEKSKGNCTAIECVKQIEPENTVEQIDKIVGVKGKLQNEKTKEYYWELSEDTGIEVTYNSSNKGTINAKIKNSSIANKKVDFSKHKELQTRVRSGISYEDFITYIGNVEGVIVGKTSTTTKYMWVSKNGGYIKGTFSNTTKKCTFITGMVK